MTSAGAAELYRVGKWQPSQGFRTTRPLPWLVIPSFAASPGSLASRSSSLEPASRLPGPSQPVTSPRDSVRPSAGRSSLVWPSRVPGRTRPIWTRRVALGASDTAPPRSPRGGSRTRAVHHSVFADRARVTSFTFHVAP